MSEILLFCVLEINVGDFVGHFVTDVYIIMCFCHSVVQMVQVGEYRLLLFQLCRCPGWHC